MVALEVQDVETLRESLRRLQDEVAALQASRERLILAADDDRRSLERALHEGVQQQLIALAVKLQIAGSLLGTDPAGASALLAEMRHDAHDALEEAASLAERIYPPLLETGGLAAALHSVARRSGVTATVAIAPDLWFPPEVARTVYLCCSEAFGRAAPDTSIRATVRGDEDELSFDVEGVVDASSWSDLLRDRVEALGGRLTVTSSPVRGIRFCGSIPRSR